MNYTVDWIHLWRGLNVLDVVDLTIEDGDFFPGVGYGFWMTLALVVAGSAVADSPAGNMEMRSMIIMFSATCPLK